MRVLERGHRYELANKTEGCQVLQFVKDLPQDSSTNCDGVLCQEVLRVLIDRMLDLYAQVPCVETHEIICHLRECLILFETRAARRTLEKSYAKTGLHVEQLTVHGNGHIFTYPGEF